MAQLGMPSDVAEDDGGVDGDDPRGVGGGPPVGGVTRDGPDAAADGAGGGGIADRGPGGGPAGAPEAGDGPEGAVGGDPPAAGGRAPGRIVVASPSGGGAGGGGVTGGGGTTVIAGGGTTARGPEIDGFQTIVERTTDFAAPAPVAPAPGSSPGGRSGFPVFGQNGVVAGWDSLQ